MAVPRESSVILADFTDSLVRNGVLVNKQINPVMETYEPHLPTLEKLLE